MVDLEPTVPSHVWGHSWNMVHHELNQELNDIYTADLLAIDHQLIIPMGDRHGMRISHWPSIHVTCEQLQEVIFCVTGACSVWAPTVVWYGEPCYLVKKCLGFPFLFTMVVKKPAQHEKSQNNSQKWHFNHTWEWGLSTEEHILGWGNERPTSTTTIFSQKRPLSPISLGQNPCVGCPGAFSTRYENLSWP